MIETKEFMRLADGRVVTEYFLKNSNNFWVKIIDFGACITAICTPDKNGGNRDVALGYRMEKDYIANGNYFGCVVGRLANRLKKGHMLLNGKEFQLETNNNGNLLHSGKSSYCFRLWDAKVVGDKLELELSSPDGDGGFPGNLRLKVTYSVGEDNSLAIDYSAVCDQLTVLNPTNHCYFNLNGAGSGAITTHQFKLNALKRSIVDEQLIPTGELRAIAETEYDLLDFVSFGKILEKLPQGLDDNFVLGDNKTIPAASVYAPESGIQLDCFTTEPGLQLYTGYFLDGKFIGKTGTACERFDGFCLEAQHFPDSPNHPEFPSVELSPGQEYKQHTLYRFSIK